jgi:hypothetical protein
MLLPARQARPIGRTHRIEAGFSSVR